MKRFEEQVARTCCKNPNQFEIVGLVAGIKVGSLRLTIEAEMASSCNEADMSPRLVAGTSPFVCATHGFGVKVVKVGCRPLRLLNELSATPQLLQLKFSRHIVIFSTFPVNMNCTSVPEV